MKRAPMFLAAVLTACSQGACSQGEGSGTVAGSLNVPACWTGGFDLNPDFFAAVPYRDGLMLRIQSGSDFANFSDGLAILVDDITKIRPNPSAGIPGLYGQPLRIDMPPEVTPPGIPVVADPDPALVSVALYLQRSCRTQTVALHAVDEVALPTDGTCLTPAMKGVDPAQACRGDLETPAGVGSGKSVITFTSLGNGKLDEETAAERLNAGCFDIYFADPREVKAGEKMVCRGHIRGSFSFFFERGRPSQPFP